MHKPVGTAVDADGDLLLLDGPGRREAALGQCRMIDGGP
jgi:hypothetical protein